MLLRIDGALTRAALHALANHQVLAVQVAGYYPAQLCARLADRLTAELDDAAHQRLYESNVPAFTETNRDRAARQAYLAGSVTAMAKVRQLCQPHQSPIDRLRCELDELWPGGANLLRMGDRPLVFGMLRIWRDGAQAMPHLDVLGQVAPDVPGAASFTEQLGVNVYLRTPAGADDGLVEIWNVGIGDLDPARHGISGTYGYRRELLAAPAAVVRPGTGDLLLLRSTRLHAVRPTSRGQRITLSGFAGITGEDGPLRLWS